MSLLKSIQTDIYIHILKCIFKDITYILQRGNMILTDDSDTERALLARALTINTAPADITINHIPVVAHEGEDNIVNTLSLPQPKLDDQTVLTGNESIESGSDSLLCNLEVELIHGGSSMVVKDTVGKNDSSLFLFLLSLHHKSIFLVAGINTYLSVHAISVSFIICMLTLLLKPLGGLHFYVGLDFVTPSL
jgi:hypothetical protein